MTKILSAPLSLMLVFLIGCNGSSSTGLADTAKPAHPNGTPIDINGEVIDTVTIPEGFPLQLYIRKNTTKGGDSASGPVEINRLLLATKPAKADNSSGYIQAEEQPIESVSILARQKIDSSYLGNTYIDLYSKDDSVSKSDHKEWLIYELADESSSERWTCITRIPDWGDVLVFIGSPNISKDQLIGVLANISLNKQITHPENR